MHGVAQITRGRTGRLADLGQWLLAGVHRSSYTSRCISSPLARCDFLYLGALEGAQIPAVFFEVAEHLWVEAFFFSGESRA